LNSIARLAQWSFEEAALEAKVGKPGVGFGGMARACFFADRK
jgi:hypothetical protein